MLNSLGRLIIFGLFMVQGCIYESDSGTSRRTIYGKITDERGYGLDRVSVGVSEYTFVDHDYIGGTDSNKEGYYEIIVPRGKFNVAFQKKGYIGIYKAPVDTRRNLRKELNVSLPVDSCEISGIIIDSRSRTGIGRVKVSVIPVSYNPSLKEVLVETSPDGSYVIKDLEYGTYRLIFRKNGYKEESSPNIAIGYNGENKSVIVNYELIANK